MKQVPRALGWLLAASAAVWAVVLVAGWSGAAAPASSPGVAGAASSAIGQAPAELLVGASGTAAAAVAAVAAAAPEPGFPPEFYRRYPPGTRVALRLPEVSTGISIGGGKFVPPLNGVREADGIPPIKRDRRLPPPGPVVAKIIDLSGQEWWLHADGSQTSCSFASVTGADGAAQRIVSTQHGAPPAGGGHGALGTR